MHRMDGSKIRFRKFERETPSISAVLKDKTLVELVYDPFDKRTAFAVFKDGRWRIEKSVVSKGGERLVPYRADNTLIKHNVVLFPSEPEDYGSTADLLADICDYIHRYVGLSEHFELFAAHYALFTWVYDRFNELPYLRLRGEFGTGEDPVSFNRRLHLPHADLCERRLQRFTYFPPSRSLRAARSFSTRPISVSRDASADIAKILNNGNVKGFPVLRSESKDGKEFNPRAFNVFGPKLVGMRGHFDDPALESRFLTENAGGKLRRDIPVNLPDEQRFEALRLRNKLLMYRFRNYFRFEETPPFPEASLEPRLNQILSPLAAVMEDEDAREALLGFAKESHELLQVERDASLEAQVLTVIRLLSETASAIGVPIKKVTALYNRTFGKDYGRPATAKWMGGIVRRRLNLKTHKSHGVFVVGPAEQAKLKPLYERYGVTDEDVDALASEPGALSGELRLERSQAGDFRDIEDIPTLPTIS